MQRYLLNMSYLGTSFRGVQRQVRARDDRPPDPSTIQGQIEIGLRKMRPINIPAPTISSRTDSGVHAIHTTMHVDLQRPGSKPYTPLSITGTLNQYFHKNSIPIRILKTYFVPNDFHCRHNAITRTYMYRLVVIQNDELKLVRHLPIQEYERCLYFSSNNFDVDKAREAAKLFLGLHDFRTFMHRSPSAPNKMTRRTMKTCEIHEARPFWSNSYTWPFCVHVNESNYNVYEIIMSADGFLHKQVRRTVASLIAVAKGIVTTRDIKFMLEIPSHRSWNPVIATVPAQGLYLCEVAYSGKDRLTFEE